MKVELLHIHKYFGANHANDDVSMIVEAGTIHGLLGENGAGKSTLVKMLSGFISRDSGEIKLDGAPVEIRTPIDAIRMGVGMLHQDPMDFPPLSVLENFMAGSPDGKTFLNRNMAAKQLRELSARFNFSIEQIGRAHV